MSGDPVESERPEELRREILRLRELLAEAHAEVGDLQGRLSEVSGSLAQCEGLGEAYDELLARHQRLVSLWPLRIAGRVRRMLRPG